MNVCVCAVFVTYSLTLNVLTSSQLVQPGDSSVFLIREESLSWGESRVVCQARYGDLAVISTQHELDFIVETLSDQDGKYWIGLTRSGDVYEWVDGSDVNPTMIPSERPPLPRAGGRIVRHGIRSPILGKSQTGSRS